MSPRSHSLIAALTLLLIQLTISLQPPPSTQHQRQPPSTTVRAYLAAAQLPHIRVLRCGTDSSAAQTFERLPNSSLLLADGRCLLRNAAAENGITAGPCDDSSSSKWMLAPCTATGCTTGSNQSWVLSALDGRVLGIPGAVGPTVDVWTVDNPTGALHNELWAWNASDATVRSLNLGSPNIFQQCLSVVAPPPPPPPCTLSPRVGCHVGTWDSAPMRTPSNGVVDGPLLGNGDLGAVLSFGAAEGYTLHLGKSDLWATNTGVDLPAPPPLHSDTFYTSIAGGQLNLKPYIPHGSAVFSATQRLADAHITANAAYDTINASISAFIASDENTLLATLTLSCASPTVTQWNISLVMGAMYGLPVRAGVTNEGVASPVLWGSKGGVTSTDNSMLLMPCDTRSYVIWPSVNTFALNASSSPPRLQLLNGTQRSVLLCPRRVGPTKLSLGPCDTSVDSYWALVPPPPSAGAPTGSLQLQLAGNTSVCAWSDAHQYHNSGGTVRIFECAAQKDSWWTWDSEAGQLHANETQCLAAVPPNVNITLGLGLVLLNGNDSSPVPFITSMGVPSASTASVTGVASLASGREYILVLTAATTRDEGWAVDPVDAAVARANAFVSAPQELAARTANHSEWWDSFWAASSLFLGDARQLLEGRCRALFLAWNYVLVCAVISYSYYVSVSDMVNILFLISVPLPFVGFWYGAQYLLGCTAREGKIAPGLWGVWAVTDEMGWNGGEGGRLDMRAYISEEARVTDNGFVCILIHPITLYCYINAKFNRGCSILTLVVVNPPPPHAHTLADYTIDYNFQANYYGACSSNRCGLMTPFFASIASDWHMELSRQRASAHWRIKGSAGRPGETAQSMTCGYMDNAYEDPAICPTRTSGGYAGIEMTTHIGPFAGLHYYSDLSVRVVAPMTAASFIVYADSTGDVTFLNDTAYPFLDATADFFLTYVTPNAAGGFDILDACAQEICGGGPNGENNPHHTIAFVIAVLRALLRYGPLLGRGADKMTAWQSLLDGLVPLPVGLYKNVSVWTEANDTAAQFLSNAAGYPIVYTAALHPAETVGLSSHTADLSIAWNTVSVLAASNDWKPMNGLCMGWPPATRVAGPSRASGILDGWEGALIATMNNNFYPDLKGGGIEQAGATEAVNSALLQSQEGYLRLFPMWPPSENASFVNLRARGAFLVTASWSAIARAVVPPVFVADVSTGRRLPGLLNCSFLSPWSSAGVEYGAAAPVPVVRRLPSNVTMPVTPGGTEGVWVFVADEPGAVYSLWPSS